MSLFLVTVAFNVNQLLSLHVVVCWKCEMVYVAKFRLVIMGRKFFNKFAWMVLLLLLACLSMSLCAI